MIFKPIKTIIKYVLKITTSIIILLIIYFASTGNLNKLIDTTRFAIKNFKISNILQTAKKSGIIKIIPANSKNTDNLSLSNGLQNTTDTTQEQTNTQNNTSTPNTITLYYPSPNKPLYLTKQITLSETSQPKNANNQTFNLFNLPDYTPVKLHINIKEPVTLHCKVLSSKASTALGYMYKPKIDKYECLVFAFKEPSTTPFYMKNVNFNLDIIFLDKNLNIINVVNNAPSCKQKNCPLYFSPKPYRIVIEMKGNNFKEFAGL